jgi:beta-barrel assembly-enhancing protease
MARRAPRSSMGRIGLAIIIAIISLVSYFSLSEFNPITGETQRIDMTVEQEIALGFQAAPELAQQHGGLSRDQRTQEYVRAVGQRIVTQSSASEAPYPFEFNLLADDQTINAFALPGGPMFITMGLLNRLQTEGELAGVLGHEVGHVVGRHSAEQIAKARLTEGLTGAAVLATYDPNDPSTQRTAQVAALIGQIVNMRFGREDELESDRLGVRFMAEAGYDPRALIRVMQVLAEAGGGQSQPEFFSTHPNPDNRIQNIEAAIREQFPNGVPDGLIP